MLWFFLALIAYFFGAVTGLLDKFLLKQRATTQPLVYSFYIGILSGFSLILAPLGLTWPGISFVSLALFTGLILFLSIWAFFKALDINEPSRVFTLLGGLTPVLVLILSMIFLGEHLSRTQLFSFVFLVLGGTLIYWKVGHMRKSPVVGLKFIVLNVFLTAIALVLIKYLYSWEIFVNAFIWTRLGIFLGALFLLISATNRRLILNGGRQSKDAFSALLVSEKLLAGIAALMLNLAIALSSVTLVNAMQGVQYAFLLILILVFSKRFPFLFEEKMSRAVIVQKIIAVFLIAVGLIMLTA